MGLDRKVAIVTGASRGIGKAIAIGLGREGAKVVVAARTEQETGKLPGTIHETVYEIIRTGGEAIAVKCNVASEEDAESLVARTLDAWGQVDVLVNNAGIGSYLPFTEVSVKHWDLVTAVNLRGPFLCTKFVLPELTRRGTGSILNISSHAAGDIFSMTAPNTVQCNNFRDITCNHSAQSPCAGSYIEGCVSSTIRQQTQDPVAQLP